MKTKLNLFINIGMLLLILVCGITGILKIPELDFRMGDDMFNAISAVHDWSGVAVFVLAVAHVLLHAKWFARVFGQAAAKVLSLASAIGRKLRATKARGIKMSILLAALVFAASYDSYARSGGGRHRSLETIPQGIDYKAGTLKDGTYRGTATGYEPNLTVEVSVKNGSIGGIKIVDHSETMRWFRRVQDVIPDRILTAQSTNIDAVSGCTASSYGIMSAVEDALKNAKK